MKSKQKKSDIGLIPFDARIEQLGNCLELIIDHRGKTPKKMGSDWVDKGVPVVSAKNVKGNRLVNQDSIRFVTKDVYFKWMKDDVKAGDLFLASEGATLGEFLYWDFDYPIVLGQRIFCIRTDPNKLYSRYFHAYMGSLQFQAEIINRATGSSVAGLRQTELKKLRVPIVPMQRQKYIGNLLYTLNKKIELNRKMNRTLEEMVQALFKSWFIDFDPVHAKVKCSSNIELEQAAKELGISKETLELFPNKFEESESGIIPKGWKVKKFGDLVIPKKGKSITKKTIIEGNIPVVAGGLTPAYYHNQYNVEAPTITVSASGANAGYVNLYNQNIWASDCSYINKTNSDFVFSHYTFLRLKQYEITRMQQGAAQPHIYPSHLMRLNVVDCGKSLWTYLESIITPMFQKIAINEQENQTLQKTRDTLLPKLLSGELDVSELEIEGL